MSLSSWCEAYYPVPVNRGEKQDAIQQALLKWTGLRTENLEAHGLKQDDQDIRETCEIPACLSISNGSCSLCNHYVCGDCPLSLVRGGTPCMDVKDSESSSPYALWRYHGNPEAMIAWLIATETKKEETKMRVIYGSPEFWNLVDSSINWVATDKDGGIFGFEDEPARCIGCWYTEGMILNSSSSLFGFDEMPGWEKSRIRRPVKWITPDETTPVDTKVWARNHGDDWHQRHWAGNGKCWYAGETSWTSDVAASSWDEVVIAQGDLEP